MTTFSKEDILALKPCEPWNPYLIVSYPGVDASGQQIKEYVAERCPEDSNSPVVWLMSCTVDLATEFIEVVGENVDKEDAKGRTALHLAVECKNLAVVNYLLSKGANKWKRDHRGYTPNERAILSRDAAVIAAMGIEL